MFGIKGNPKFSKVKPKGSLTLKVMFSKHLAQIIPNIWANLQTKCHQELSKIPNLTKLIGEWGSQLLGSTKEHHALTIELFIKSRYGLKSSKF